MVSTLAVKRLFLSIAILFLSLGRPAVFQRRTDHEYQADCHKKCLMLKSRRVSTREVTKTSYMDDCLMQCIGGQIEEGGKHERARRTSKGDECILRPANSTDFAGLARDLKVTCRGVGKSTPLGFVISWGQPVDYVQHSYDHFEIMYSITRMGHVGSTDVNCLAVDMNTLSYVVEKVDKTDRIDVLVLAYPYPNVFNTATFKVATPCLPTTAPGTDSHLRPGDNGNIDVAVAVCSSIAAVVALAIVLVFVYRSTRQRFRDLELENLQEHGKVYVSHYPDSETHHSRLLHLVARFRREYMVNLIMDSYCEVQIADLGIARWCQSQLSTSTRVFMVISEEYLEICRKWQSGRRDELKSDDVNLNRVCNELDYVINHIFERRRNLLLTIVLDDVTEGDLPAPFRGMKTFPWPSNEDDEHVIVCDILAQEPNQVSN